MGEEPAPDAQNVYESQEDLRKHLSTFSAEDLSKAGYTNAEIADIMGMSPQW